VTTGGTDQPNRAAALFDQAATIKGFIAHFLHALKKESKWGFLYMLYPGINFIVNQIIILNLMNMFKATNDGTACGSDDDTCVDQDGTSYSTAPTTDIAGGKTVLYMCAFFYVINFALNHWFNRKFRHLKLGGKAMKNMRENMMTTMLSFSPHSQEHFPTGKVSKIMESQVENAVATTWAAVFKLEGALFQVGGRARSLARARARLAGCRVSRDAVVARRASRGARSRDGPCRSRDVSAFRRAPRWRNVPSARRPSLERRVTVLALTTFLSRRRVCSSLVCDTCCRSSCSRRSS
jgi:hypothetical protein